MPKPANYIDVHVDKRRKEWMPCPAPALPLLLPCPIFPVKTLQGWEQSTILNQENMTVDSKMEIKQFLNHLLKA